MQASNHQQSVDKSDWKEASDLLPLLSKEVLSDQKKYENNNTECKIKSINIDLYVEIKGEKDASTSVLVQEKAISELTSMLQKEDFIVTPPDSETMIIAKNSNEDLLKALEILHEFEPIEPQDIFVQMQQYVKSISNKAYSHSSATGTNPFLTFSENSLSNLNSSNNSTKDPS